MISGTDGATGATPGVTSQVSRPGDRTDRAPGGAGPEVGDRDTFLDAVKAIAIARVVAWHTWSWWWLSWIGAMPAMFFASGALLDVSVARHGYVSTLRSRTRRLLIPFWWYATCAVAVMVAVGWRPTLREFAPWVLPLGDPIGSDRTPGLWIPLWYVRAYLWFVIAAPVFRWAVDVFGRAALVIPAVATLVVWSIGRSGTDVPLAVGDFVAYGFFVFIGMLYVRGARPATRSTATLTVVAFAAAVLWCVRYGPATSIVNSSYPLVLLVGTATLGALFLLAPVLGDLRGRWGSFVTVVGRRALTIYLWQGFGLLAADELVRRQHFPGWFAPIAAIVVVVAVTAGAACAFGWVEDLAARRPIRWPAPWTVPLMSVAVVLLAGAAWVEPAPDTHPVPPPSGLAVLGREAFNEGDLGSSGPVAVDGGPQERLDATFEAWLTRNSDALDELGTSHIELTVVTGSGEELSAWWSVDGGPPDDIAVAWLSMSKLVTGAWLAQLAADGVVALDDPVSAHLDGVPHGDDITLEQLARHQGGIPESADATFDETHPRNDLQRWFDDPELAYTPGEGYEYTRVAYFLLTWALEEASGTAWTDVVHDWADASGTTVTIDEGTFPFAEPSHPGDGDYRGRLWSASGLAAPRFDSAHFFRWVLTEGITPEARELMTRFAPEDFANSLGLGIAPLCPCDDSGTWRSAPRYGSDSAIGSWAFDEETGAVMLITTDVWIHDAPEPIFYQLTHELLDAVGE